MTLALTSTAVAVHPPAGAVSLLVQNTTGGDVEISQRLVITGATEAASPTTDPGYVLPDEASITLPFSQPIWFSMVTGTGDISLTPFA